MSDGKVAKIVKGKDGKLRLENFYTPLSEAKKEIWRRWNDKALRKKVEGFLGGDVPEYFKDKPKAVFVRYIMSPNYELLYFLELTKLFNLEPLCLQYSSDKFVNINKLKYFLGKLFVDKGEGKRGDSKIKTVNIVNFNKFEGQRLCDIKTVYNDSLIDFHKKILKKATSKYKYELFDFSDWFNHHKRVYRKYYYLHYLSLFLFHGILFENFLVNEDEIDFTRYKVLPSFNKAVKIFGIKPLIFPLNPLKSENELRWFYYPENIIRKANIPMN